MLALFGFDATSVPLLRAMLADGSLPALQGLLHRGRWRDLDSPAAHFAAAAFPTVYSGVDVGDHGLYYPFLWSPRHQRVRVRADVPHPETVWERLTRSGRRTLVIDPYEGTEPERDAGRVVSGLQFHNRVVLRRWWSGFDGRRRPGRELGRAPHVDEVFGQPSVAGLLKMRDHLLRGPSRAAEFACRELAGDPPDLLWVGFPSVHIGGHWFWDLSSLPEDAGTESERALIAGTLPELYRAADEALARIVSVLPADADVVVYSPLGMAENTSLADMLAQMVAAVMAGGSSNGSGGDHAGGLWRLRSAVPVDLRAKVAGLMPDALALELTARMEFRGTDWATTAAFVPPADHSGHVRLNIRGRERDGIVEPADADRMLDALREGLESFRCADGTRAVATVARSADVVRGTRAVEQLPDLVVHWAPRRAADVRFLESGRYGRVERFGSGSGRCGNHTPDSWAIVVPGRAGVAANGSRGHVIDIAATALELLAPGEHAVPGRPLLVK